MKSISSDLSKHYELLRLIVQKMEIHTEADDMDEEVCHEDTDSCAASQETNARKSGIGWSSPALRQAMWKQALVISKWKKSETE